MDLADPLRDAVSPVISPVALGSEAGDFFDKVRILEDAFPEAARVGTSDPVTEEAVRFHGSTCLSFPPRDVESVSWERLDENRKRCHLTVTFLGLMGAISPLPATYLREMLDEEDAGREPRLKEFLDIFNHRIVSLYYRAWKKYRGHLRQDLTAEEGTARLMLALGGQDAELARIAPGQDANDELRRLLPMLGPLTRRVRSAAAVESCVQVLLRGAPVEVRPWIPRWVEIPEGQVCRLGELSTELGTDLVIGDRVRDRSGRCEVRIGPVGLDLFRSLYPGEELWRRLNRLLARSLPTALEYQVVVILDEGQAGEPTTLGEGTGSLGRDTWLGTPHGRDREVLFPPGTLHPEIAPSRSKSRTTEPVATFAAAGTMEETRDA